VASRPRPHPQLTDFVGAVPADTIEKFAAEMLPGLARLPAQCLSEISLLLAEAAALLSSAAPGGEPIFSP
jgi:hypothetical protein